MKLSKYYLPILKEAPREATLISHQYCLRAGMIKKIASGIYTWLPLGLRVLHKIQNIIRKGMEDSGAIEVLMPIVQPANLWQESGRYNDYGEEMLRCRDRHHRDMLFSPTHEELITDTLRGTLNTYQNMPVCFYQINWKFRDEIRPRFGVMRAREFLMKDAYSFDISMESALASYHLMFNSYIKIFRNMGLFPITVKADAGAIGGDLSHEFHIVAENGESKLFYDKRFNEIFTSGNIMELLELYTADDISHNPDTCPISKDSLVESRGIEVGHIFYLGDKYSSKMNLSFDNQNGGNQFVHMGCYGIGVSRLVGAIIESSHDDRGIIWPESVAPFNIGLINLHTNSSKCVIAAENIYHILKTNEVLYDDTNENPSKKFMRMDMIGIPWQVIIGKKYEDSGVIEIKCRKSNQREIMTVEEMITRFK